jgi:transcriptional regulator with XRE-family HTH domain
MDQNFGELLRGFRLAAGFGLRRFAEMVDIKPSNLSDIEHGRRNPPEDAAKLREIAAALGLVNDTAEMEHFFDAARRPGTLPADVRHMADRRMVAPLLRTVDNLQLDDTAIARLIDQMAQSHPRAGHGTSSNSGVRR